MEEVVVIVGAGPSGLATSACLNVLSIPNIILEREDCYNSLWKKRAYDRLKLHLATEFCHLPHMPIPSDADTYMTREKFMQYVDNYVSNFQLNPKYHQSVESAIYDALVRKWRIEVRNKISGQVDTYMTKYLVVATGENSEGFIPMLPELESFEGETMHSNQYKSGAKYNGKEVLVVGCGNSGMEIAYDLSNYGACTSIVIRSPLHILTKEMVHLGMRLLKYLPCSVVDFMIVLISKLWYGNLSKHGLERPRDGPFFLKSTTGRSPVLDVGTVDKIRRQQIKVLPGISKINRNSVEFDNGSVQQVDVIIFATGYKSTANYWLKDYEYILNKDGMPKCSFPNHWKGSNGLYCAGLSRRGLAGVSMDAHSIANDIKMIMSQNKEKCT